MNGLFVTFSLREVNSHFPLPIVRPQWLYSPWWRVRGVKGFEAEGLFFYKSWNENYNDHKDREQRSLKRHECRRHIWCIRKTALIQHPELLLLLLLQSAVSLCWEILHWTIKGQTEGVILKMRSSLVLAALLCFTTWMSIANASEYHKKKKNRSRFLIECMVCVWQDKTKGV